MTEKLSKSDYIALLGAVILFIAAALLFQLHYLPVHFGQASFPDEKNYYLNGARLIREYGIGYFFEPRSLWNAPLNIVWVWLLGENVSLIRVMNVLLMASAGVMLWDVCRRQGSKLSGYIAILVFYSHIPVLRFAGTILSEPLFVFFICASFWAFSVSQVRSWAFTSGVLLGFATLTRPTPWLLPIWVLVLGRLFGSPREFRPYIAVLLGMLLITLPYMMKNYVFLDRFTIANGVGAVLFLGNDLKNNGDEPVYSGRNFDTYEITKPYKHLDTEGDRLLLSAAVKQILDNPIGTLMLTIRKPFRYLFGSYGYYLYPYRSLKELLTQASLAHLLLKAYELVMLLIVVTLGIRGMLSKESSSRQLRLFAVLVVSYFVVVHTVLFPIPRLALPIFPILAVFAALWMGSKFRSVYCEASRSSPFSR